MATTGRLSHFHSGLRPLLRGHLGREVEAGGRSPLGLAPFWWGPRHPIGTPGCCLLLKGNTQQANHAWGSPSLVSANMKQRLL